ncbi:FAD-dependent oxidoreductase, partial [Bacillus sp. SIMBA_154]|uniref:FAD-dependent oxidoreductase n=1 Tax=Bacillus sp. SIMBA_154 TaxID=3080859 RepID=UPI00397A68B9
VPNVTLAEQAGLEVERGIKVNDDGQTSRPAIFALGDCAQTSQGWQPYIAPINQILPALVNSLLGNVTNAEFLPSPVIVKT